MVSLRVLLSIVPPMSQGQYTTKVLKATWLSLLDMGQYRDCPFHTRTTANWLLRT